MPLGVVVQPRTAPPSRGAPTDTGTWFVAGQANSGTLTDAKLLRSIADFVSEYGVRETANAAAFDALDTFFREGGSRAYFGRYTDAGTVDSGLNLFPRGLGPGQVSVIGDETPGAALYGKLLDHAATHNRFALMDVGMNDTVAAMEVLGGAVPDSNQTYGAVFGPWLNIPGPSGVVGAGTRQVPASSVVAALCQRVDALGNPNRAAAGRDFPLQYVTSFVRNITDQERVDLLNLGVNTFATVYGVLELYGFQTTVPQNETDPFWQANCSRARMWMTGEAYALGENYMFKPIDGRGRLAGALKKDLDGMLLTLYEANGLYGATPMEAFATTVGVSVNTEATVAQGELHATCEARLSLHAKAVIIDLVSVPITGRVSTT
jgi:hypothetical protein